MLQFGGDAINDSSNPHLIPFSGLQHGAHECWVGTWSCTALCAAGGGKRYPEPQGPLPNRTTPRRKFTSHTKI